MGHDAKINPQSREFVGSGALLDSRGRPLEVGDEVILSGQGPVYAFVTKIVPLLDPGVPPGMLRVEFRAAYVFMAPQNQRQLEFARVQTAEEVQAVIEAQKAAEADRGPRIVS